MESAFISHYILDFCLLCAPVYDLLFLLVYYCCELKKVFPIYPLLYPPLYLGCCCPWEGHARAGQENECKILAQLWGLRQKRWGKASQGSAKSILNHIIINYLTKVALTTISLWFMAWTPYLVICYFGLFKIEGLTPLTTIWGATFAKTSAVYNPIVYGIR